MLLLPGALAHAADNGGVATAATAATTRFAPQPERELPERRTERSATRLLADGTYETRVSQVPLHYRDAAGEWRPIENELVARPDGSLANGANSVDVEIPKAADGDVTYADGGSALSFSLVGADEQSNAVVDDAAATFPDAIDGVDVEYETVGRQLKETLTLSSAEAPSEYLFDVDSNGLEPRVEPSGAVTFRDEDGRARLAFAAPWMKDAAGDVSRGARYEIVHGGERSRIALRLDHDWLAARDRSYPVVVDPTVYGEPEHGCEIRSGARSNTSFCDGSLSEMWIGRDAGGIVHRGLFDLDGLREAVPPYVQVLDSWLALYLEGQSVAETSTVDLHHLTRDFAPGVTWNRFDGRALWTRAGGDYVAERLSRRATTDAGTDGWMGFDMTELASRVVAEGEPSDNLLVKAADESRAHIDAFVAPEVMIRWAPWTGLAPRFTFEDFPLSDGSTLRFNVGNWNLAMVSNDIDLESDDGRFTVGRYFNLLNHGESSGTFGRGSRGDFGSIALELKQDGSYIFRGPGADDGLFDKRNDGTFAPPVGVDAELTEQPDGRKTIVFNDSTETWTFDVSGRLVQTAQDYGYTIDGTYGADGLATLADSLGNTATFAYDGNGDMRTITDDQSAVHRYDYDGQHRLIAYTSPTGAATRYSYDSRGRNLPA